MGFIDSIKGLVSSERRDVAQIERDLERLRADGFYSNNLNIGNSLDKSEMFAFSALTRVNHQVKDAMRRSNGLITRIIDMPISDATRQGIDIRNECSEDLESWIEDQQLWTLASEAAKDARALGMAAIPLDVMDYNGSRLSLTDSEAINLLRQPVDIRKVQDVRIGEYGPVLDLRYVQPVNYVPGVRPEYYEVDIGSKGRVVFHRSRLMIFQGMFAGHENARQHDGNYESIIDLIYAPFRNYETDHSIASTIMKDFTQPILKLGSFAKIAAGNTSDVVTAYKAQLKTMHKLLSVTNALLLGPNDDYVRQTVNVNGIDKLIEAAKQYLCSCTGIPASKLYGERAGASLGEAGQSQTSDWDDVVSDHQKQRLNYPIRQVLSYVAASKGFCEPIRYKWNPLRQPTPMESAKIRTETARADAIEIGSGVIRPEWVTWSRYSGGEYNAQIAIPEELHEQIEQNALNALNQAQAEQNLSIAAQLEKDEKSEKTDAADIQALIIKRLNDPGVKGIYDTRAD